jgi:excisionase family DNA binding protein
MPAGNSDQETLFNIELLTIQQVAEWAKVSPKTIYRWIERGEIPVVKFGNRTYRVPAGAVIEQLRKAGLGELIICTNTPLNLCASTVYALKMLRGS